MVLKNFAGLEIRNEKLFFVSLDEFGNVAEKFTAENFSQLPKIPVVLGLPSSEFLIQLINIPIIGRDDMRDAIALNFEEYFNFPESEAVFDVIDVNTPAGLQVLAMAAKKSTVKKFLDAMRRANIFVRGVEPGIFAMVRAVPEGRKGLCVFADIQNIAAAWQGEIIFFRTTDENNIIQDITNTLQFLNTQYRNAKIARLILFGIDYEFEIPTLKITDEYITAKGLAMRGDDNFLDLRTKEYIHDEKQREIFGLDKIICYVLIAAFGIFSVGAIIFAQLQSAKTGREILALMDANENFLQARAELSASNFQLESRKNFAEKVFGFLKNDIPALEIMNAIEESSESEIKLDRVEISRGSIMIYGRAENHKSILRLSEGLKSSELFSDVEPPISNKNLGGGISFKIFVKVK